MDDNLLQKWTEKEIAHYYADLKLRCGEEAARKLLNIKDESEKSNFTKEVAVQLEPYWQDISDYQSGNLWKQLCIRIKYFFIRSRRAECNVPQHVLEAIAETMLPDIRAFFESEEGKREFEEWKAEQEKKKAEAK